MKENSETLIGGINLFVAPTHPDKGTLNNVPGAQRITYNNTNGIFIPIEGNPCINIWNQDGDVNKQIISLALSIKEKNEPSEKSTHFAKAYVSKVRMQTAQIPAEKEKEITPIIGNFKKYTNSRKEKQMTCVPTPVTATENIDDIGDLPEDDYIPDDKKPKFQDNRHW